MRKLSLTLLCALALSACVSPPEDIDRVPNFDPTETLMGQIQQRRSIRIGIPDSWGAPFVTEDKTTFDEAGFLPALSNEMAEALGVDVEYLPLDEDDAILPGRPTETSPVDISFVSIPATEELAKGHPLTHPYWVAHQRVLAPVDSGIEEWTDIEGSFCAILDEETGFDPSETDPSLERIDGTVPECARMLKHGDVEAVTAPDIDLMAVWAAVRGCQQPCEPSGDYAIVGDELTTEGYSAMLPVGSPGWSNFVNATWGEAEAEGRWFNYYEEWIAPYGIVLEEAPDMRIEEAAGLFPCESAC